MARAEYDQMSVGTSDAAGATAIFAEVAAQSGAVTAENLGEEGMDGAAFASGAVTQKAFAPLGDGTVKTQALTTAWVPVPISPGNLRSTPVVLLANESLRVRGHVELLSDVANHGVVASGEIAVRVGFQESGPFAGFAPFESRTVMPQRAMDDGLAGSPAILPITAWIDGPISLDWVQLEIRDQSGNDTSIQYGRVAMYGTVFRGVF